MAFAQPLGLLFFALFIPIVLLYLLKQRRRHVIISSLMFWDKILRDEQTTASLSKLKKILSLLLQLLFITLLTLALARPLGSKAMLGARRIVLFVDTSASMWVREGETTRFEEAQQKSSSVVQGMSIGDTLMLVTVADRPDIVSSFTDSKKDLLEAIELLQPTHANTQFKTAFDLLEYLPPDERETYVYLVSDGAFEPVDFTFPAHTRFAYLRVGMESDNVGITSFQVRPLLTSARDFEILMQVSNESEEERRVPVEVRIDNALVDAYELALESGQSETKTLRQFSSRGGKVEAILDVSDPFPLDNRAYGILRVPQPIPVLLVTEGNLFLENALSTDDGINLQTILPSEYTGESGWSVMVFDRWAPSTAPPASCIYIRDWPDDLGLVKTGVIERPLFSDWRRSHPINRHLALTNVSIEKAIRVAAPDDFAPLASSFGDPLILLRENSNRNILVTTFDTSSTDLPLRVAFPMLVSNAIRYMAGVDLGNRWQNPTIGEILTQGDLNRFIEKDTGDIVAIVSPNGERIDLAQDEPLIPVDQVGFYDRETADGNHISLFAANLFNQRESRIKPEEEPPIQSAAPLPVVAEGFRL
ncbi:MAG: BatA and WFA domain-containing protein, partial [bacterium]